MKDELNSNLVIKTKWLMLIYTNKINFQLMIYNYLWFLTLGFWKLKLILMHSPASLNGIYHHSLLAILKVYLNNS